MAKIKLIEPYRKALVQRDPETNEVLTSLDGKPLYQRDARGKVLFEVKFLYGWDEWEDDELDLYKDMHTQEGDDTYRESDGGVPYYFSNFNYGNEAELKGYTKSDGTIGFVIPDTEASILHDQMNGEFADFPEIRAELGRKLLHARSKGELMNVKAKEKELAAKALAAKEAVKTTAGGKKSKVTPVEGEKLGG